MDNIIEPNETFDFTQLSLAHPIGIQGGAYFTKIEYNKKPLYIQTCKSQTRQGFVKTGKKYYCDLMFDKNSESLINWFEKFEEKCQKLIFERRDTWFQNSLEENDIESAFNSTIRVYKSGKYYLVRTNIKNNHNNTPSIKIYNENEIPMTMEEINNETNIISILEIQGIKFTSRNFQIEIELKQIMVLDNAPLFDNCLIKTPKKSHIKPLEEDTKIDELKIENIKIDENNLAEFTTEVIKENNPENILDELEDIDMLVDPDIKATLPSVTATLPSVTATLPSVTATLPSVQDQDENNEDILTFDLEFEDLNEDIKENTDELKEFNNNELSLETTLETIQLKKPNQVYFELYKEARKKAKEAKKNAIIAYLEAKNIKKTYMIENIEDSESEFDAEIDEVSESELDDF
jgi:hypothetical protein